ncbi:hypothetical protein FR483_n188L [Paramecium bursaria Chlorella virus FR483]|uniref:Uncharacterized protein n188L n=1 Tax=Paramecium bursaria Chlorella virus FR483 TaxID=399781 RepID=A7J6P2_PBCVF|nr:hypothetical protein FR483_n188L [Paramecium bursaria Chlorella virus FR483]ABT15473.1 hypothetical protein FR483_n188L [Paramecium bursaria Chlorella virus FR483]
MSSGAIAWGGVVVILPSASTGSSVIVTSWHLRHFILTCGKQRSRKRWSYTKMTTGKTFGLTNSGSVPLLKIIRTLMTMESMMAQRPHGRSARHTSTTRSRKMITPALRTLLTILKKEDILK